ncbi:MAG: hypothetical protein H6729_05050 [Deltaproteobacteria bacterium]|nr:hypothetical protein [Deltaproteobacteria bacterium]
MRQPVGVGTPTSASPPLFTERDRVPFQHTREPHLSGLPTAPKYVLSRISLPRGEAAGPKRFSTNYPFREQVAFRPITRAGAAQQLTRGPRGLSEPEAEAILDDLGPNAISLSCDWTEDQTRWSGGNAYAIYDASKQKALFVKQTTWAV